MSGLNLGLIKALRLPVPPRKRQEEFAQATARIRSLTRRMESHPYEEELFRSLVARTFLGDIGMAGEAC